MDATDATLPPEMGEGEIKFIFSSTDLSEASAWLFQSRFVCACCCSEGGRGEKNGGERESERAPRSEVGFDEFIERYFTSSLLKTQIENGPKGTGDF